MADKKTQRMAQFYEQCQAKGYTDMHDDKQSLKAKVIATDLKLNYGDIVAFYEKAKQAKAQIDREKAEEAEQCRIQRQKEAEVAARRAVNGELLVTISDHANESDDAKIIRVYIRPDKSIYSILNNGGKIEGAPSVSVKKGGALLLTYHPPKAVFTGATVGGVTTGGVHHTEAYYSPSTTNSGTSDVAVSLNGTEFTAAIITMSGYTGELFRRDSAYKILTHGGRIQCYRESVKADSYVSAALSGHADYATAMNALSMAVDERRLPYITCANIANLLGRVVHGQFPPSDEQVYDMAASLANADSSATLKQAYEMFDSISDYKDAARQSRIVRSKYDEVLQEEKERAVLAKEARKKKVKKVAIIIGIIIVAILVVAILLNAVIIPSIKYNAAVGLMESEKYEDAIAAFNKLGDFKDSELKANDCINSMRDKKYSAAIVLMESGRYEEAIEAFKAINGHKDSVSRISACQDILDEEVYQQAVIAFENRDFDKAVELFSSISGYKDSSSKVYEALEAQRESIMEIAYQDAEKMLSRGDVAGAALAFGELVGYKDSFQRSLDLRDKSIRNTLVVGGFYMVGIKKDGTAVGTIEKGDTYSSGNKIVNAVSGWKNLIDIQHNGSCVFGLTENGTVYTTGEFPVVEEWTNIVQIVVGYETVIGLKADGTVVSTNDNNYDLSAFTDIYELNTLNYWVYGVKKDGTTVAQTHDVSGGGLDVVKIDWDGVKEAERINGTILKLTDSGNLSANGQLYLNGKKLDVSSWTNIVDIMHNDEYLIGVSKTGRTYQSGSLNCNIYSWSNIARVYHVEISSAHHLFALKSDGTVIRASEKPAAFDYDLTKMKNIRVPEV